jgi:hypothetical protein
VNLHQARIRRNLKQGLIQLVGVKIGGELILSGAELENETGPALYGDRVQVEQNSNLRVARVDRCQGVQRNRGCAARRWHQDRQRPAPGPHCIAERTSSFGAADGKACTTVELIGLGLDRGLPLSPTGVRTRCDINPDTSSASLFTIAIWLLQAAIWGLA